MCLSVHAPSIHPWIICLSIGAYTYPSICPFFYLSVHPCACLSMHCLSICAHPSIHPLIIYYPIHGLSVYLDASIHPSIHSSVHLYIHMFIHPVVGCLSVHIHPYVCIPVCSSIHPCAFLSMHHPSIHPWVICLSRGIHLSVHSYIFLYIHPLVGCLLFTSIHMSIFLFICPSVHVLVYPCIVCLSVHIYPSIHPSIHLSVRLSFPWFVCLFMHICMYIHLSACSSVCQSLILLWTPWKSFEIKVFSWAFGESSFPVGSAGSCQIDTGAVINSCSLSLDSRQYITKRD